MAKRSRGAGHIVVAGLGSVSSFAAFTGDLTAQIQWDCRNANLPAGATVWCYQSVNGAAFVRLPVLETSFLLTTDNNALGSPQLQGGDYAVYYIEVRTIQGELLARSNRSNPVYII